MEQSLSVLGAGSWGTALAILAAQNGYRTLLWGHHAEHMQALQQQRENAKYLPATPFPEYLKATASIAEACSFSSLLLIAVPSHAFKETLQKIQPCLQADTAVAWATKGFDDERAELLNHVVANTLGTQIKTAALSGPTFAIETVKGLPTAMTVASQDLGFADQLAKIFHNHHFRPYTSSDIIGVQVGGAVKNVLAIASGIADGLGFGANTRAALITRGLQEVMRLGAVLGGKMETFMGLAGLGDLVLTCTDDQSRNRRLGLALGRGTNLEQCIAEIGQEIEGISAAKLAVKLGDQYDLDLPIIEQTYQVLYHGLQPQIAVENLLKREQKPEI